MNRRIRFDQRMPARSSCLGQPWVEVHLIRGSPVKAALRSARAVEVDVVCRRLAAVTGRAGGCRVGPLVFDHFPPPFNEHVVAPAALAVHPDCHAIVIQLAGKALVGELQSSSVWQISGSRGVAMRARPNGPDGIAATAVVEAENRPPDDLVFARAAYPPDPGACATQRSAGGGLPSESVGSSLGSCSVYCIDKAKPLSYLQPHWTATAPHRTCANAFARSVCATLGWRRLQAVGGASRFRWVNLFGAFSSEQDDSS